VVSRLDKAVAKMARSWVGASGIRGHQWLLGKPVQRQMVVLGHMSLGGYVVQVESLAATLQVAFDAGAKRLLIPMSSVNAIPTVPGELFAKFQTGFYSEPVDAVFKALGVD
jgi:ATP-dependent Lon protease